MQAYRVEARGASKGSKGSKGSMPRDASQLPADFTPISEEEYKRLLEHAVKVDAP